MALFLSELFEPQREVFAVCSVRHDWLSSSAGEGNSDLVRIPHQHQSLVAVAEGLDTGRTVGRPVDDKDNNVGTGWEEHEIVSPPPNLGTENRNVVVAMQKSSGIGEAVAESNRVENGTHLPMEAEEA
ncbi:hypothetical protein PQX77_014977 [Marasmius sp. AFHP31]|nr:hypothetical protein PQX77_014977 [Marasmius sp. AFHP31]